MTVHQLIALLAEYRVLGVRVKYLHFTLGEVLALSNAIGRGGMIPMFDGIPIKVRW